MASSVSLPRPLTSLALIAILTVVLQVPISMVRALIEERVETRDNVEVEVTAAWGGAQAIIGPHLLVPFRSSVASAGAQQVAGVATFLPDELHVEASVASHPLDRGLFTIPAYRADVSLRGTFHEPDVRALGLEGVRLDWERAALVVEISDPKTIAAGSALQWADRDIALLPGALADGRSGVHAVVPIEPGGDATFVANLELTGSGGLRFVPNGRSTTVSLSSDWPDPSFRGAWLPTSRAVESSGFSAEWIIPFLGRDYPQQWTSADEPYDRIVASGFGVDLYTPVDHYRMAERSTKYAPLFLVFTFGIFWLFDVLVGVRVHPVQYLLAGAAMCMFYLLELSLSEHIGFLAAYATASGAVTVLVASYARAVLQSTLRGVGMGGAMGLLYAYLLSLLSLERYALLVGSVGLFMALGAVMYLTRWIDWDHVGGDPAPVREG